MNFAELWNTPGFFYAVGYSMTTAVMLSRIKSAGGVRLKWLSGIATWAFISLLLQLTAGSEGLLFIATMVAVFAAMVLCFYVNVRDWMRALFIAVKVFIYSECASSLVWLVYYSLALGHPRLQSVFWLNTIMFGGFLALMSLLWLMERSLDRIGVEPALSWRDLLVEFLIGLSVYVVSNLGYIDRDSLLSGSQARDIFAIRTLVDFNGVGMLFLLQYQLIRVQARYERDTLHSIMQMQYQAYQLSQESIDLVNQKYHDLKHQIALLRRQASSEKAEENLNRLEKDIQKYEAQHNTGNPVLDAVLTSKSLTCQNHGIELKCIVNGALLGFMDDMEVAALFGNMLDNAIESVERIDDPARRLIRLTLTGEKGFLRIRIENTCAERISFVDGLPVTHKRDKRYHGFGVKSMQRTVEKYGGSLVAEQREDWFILKILIPLIDK